MKNIFIPMQLRCARQRNKKTLQNVSEDLGISLSFLSDIERGCTMPSLKTLIELCDYYNGDNEAFTDIYNRCYEAVLMMMDERDAYIMRMIAERDQVLARVAKLESQLSGKTGELEEGLP